MSKGSLVELSYADDYHGRFALTSASKIPCKQASFKGDAEKDSFPKTA